MPGPTSMGAHYIPTKGLMSGVAGHPLSWVRPCWARGSEISGRTPKLAGSRDRASSHPTQLSPGRWNPRRRVLCDPWLQVRCAWEASAKQPGEILDGQGLCEEKSLRD